MRSSRRLDYGEFTVQAIAGGTITTVRLLLLCALPVAVVAQSVDAMTAPDKLILHAESFYSPQMLLGTVSYAGFEGRLPLLGKEQPLPDSGDSARTVPSTTPVQPDLAYMRPTQRTKVHNYLFDTYGPYPFVGAAFAAGVNQATNSPPDWMQGAAGFGKRFGSNLAIAAVTMTTRYALAEALKEDTLYYRCECTGVFPRLKHAVISTWTARRGADGHRVFSIPALVAPYVGTMTAVYGWYPGRFGARDALRMGNYSMLAYMGGNIALEFLYGGPHSLLSRMHLNNRHGAPSSDSKP